MAPLLDDATASMTEARAALDAAKAAGKSSPETFAAVQKFGESVEKIYVQDAELAQRLFPTYVDESLFRTAQVQAKDAVMAAHAAEAAAAAASHVDEAAAAVAPVLDDAVEAAAPVVDNAVEAAAPVTNGAAGAVDEAIVRAGGEVPVTAAPVAATTTAPTLPNATADAVEATIARPTTSTGSVIGENWVPGATGEGKFTGTVSELLDRASAPRPTVAAPVAAPVEAVAPASVARVTETPLTLTVNARGEAVTGSGLVIPSYASPVSGLAPADGITDAGIQRLQDMMNRVRAGA
jgi:hypothetical protein